MIHSTCSPLPLRQGWYWSSNPLISWLVFLATHAHSWVGSKSHFPQSVFRSWRKTKHHPTALIAQEIPNIWGVGSQNCRWSPNIWEINILVIWMIRYLSLLNHDVTILWKDTLRLSTCCLVTESCPTLWPPWTVAWEAPLSVEFSRLDYWSGLPFPSPGDLPGPGLNLCLLPCRWIPHHWATWETWDWVDILLILQLSPTSLGFQASTSCMKEILL